VDTGSRVYTDSNVDTGSNAHTDSNAHAGSSVYAGSNARTDSNVDTGSRGYTASNEWHRAQHDKHNLPDCPGSLTDSGECSAVRSQRVQ
jgi:hypothetical protein